MNLFKKGAIILAAAALLFTAGCSNNNNSSSGSSASAKTPEPSTITAKLQSDLKFPEMIEVKSDRLSKYYTVPEDSLKASSVFICSSSASADEIAVFEGKSEADAAKIKDAVQKRIDKKANTFKNYGQPQEYTNIQNCILETKGSYVLFAVTKDGSKAKDIMEGFFK